MSLLRNDSSMKCLAYEMSRLWNVSPMKCLSIKCFVYEMSRLWNVYPIKCPIYEMSRLWDVSPMKYLAMKCLVYEMSRLWNVPAMKCLVYEMSKYKNKSKDCNFKHYNLYGVFYNIKYWYYITTRCFYSDQIQINSNNHYF